MNSNKFSKHAQSMIGDDIFSDFDSNTYTQLFKTELN